MVFNLSAGEYQQIIQYMLALNNAKYFESEAMDLLNNIVDFDGGAFVTFKNDSRPLNVYGYKVEPSMIKEYIETYNRKDPFFNFGCRVSSLTEPVITLSTTMQNENQNYQAYKHFLASQGIQHCMLISINEYGDGIRLFRKNGAAPFLKEEIEVCSFLAPIIGTLYKHHNKELEVNCEAKLFNILNMNMQFGSLLFDKDFKLIQSNKFGLERMSEITAKTMMTEILNDFIIIMKCMIEDEEKMKQNKTIYKTMGNYIIELLVHRELDEAGNITTHYIIFIYHKAWFRSLIILNAEKVIEQYNLTEREKQLVNLALHGYSNNQISQQLFISTYTVKEHLKSIFRKMNIRSRGELIIKVYSDRG